MRMLLEDPNTLASEISALISARKARIIGQKDLELPYHPLVVHLFQACFRRCKKSLRLSDLHFHKVIEDLVLQEHV